MFMDHHELSCDVLVAGGGPAGVPCAIAAARCGAKVILVHDRPVLGGNASSEIRLWVLGATCHLGATNRWAREGGVINEILIENLWRNPEGNPLIFDTVVLEKVLDESNLTLLLNTAAYEVAKTGADTIAAVRAFCSQNSTLYEIRAPLFCDASGDGVVGFLAGAAFRMGAEASDEFGERFAPSREYGELLGHSLYFYSKDTGRPVRFVPPSYALRDIPGRIPRYRHFNAREDGCRLWWIEWGGRLDTVHDTERIKWELWKVVYGVWDYIKNSGQFPEAANLTLEWVGQIPGKRESRRFEGDYLLRQQDVIEQRQHADAVAFGGWALDLHPADGVFSEKPGCTHWRMRGTYQIPYRCLYSRNITNLFLAGRLISVTHAAYGSTRVMGTLAHAGQAVALAAVQCRARGVLPAQVQVADLQLALLRTGQHIPQHRLVDPLDLVPAA
ncbi:MAG: FAD-dependent oxidoreductase, partial [Planctomycetes bacterium]|nr:FAD-dependent oxidoreductase [Planctomycetota bacterium]